MSEPIADMVALLLSTGIPPETVVATVRFAEQHAQAIVADDPVAAKRRAYDRERKRRPAANSTGIPPETPVRVYTKDNNSSLSSGSEEDKREEESSEEIVDGRRRSRKCGTRLPDDWQPNETELTFAGKEGLSDDDLRIEIMKFRNHWTSKTGRDATKMDWSATWRNWVLNSGGYRRNGKGNSKSAGAGNRGGDAILAGLGNIADRLAGNRENVGRAGESLPFDRPSRTER